MSAPRTSGTLSCGEEAPLHDVGHDLVGETSLHHVPVLIDGAEEGTLVYS